MRRLGPYRLGARLGSGSLGEVLLGSGPQAELVAVKRFSAQWTDNLTFVRDLTSATQAARELEMPTVVPLVGDGREDGHLWVAHEAAPGQAITSLLKRCRLDDDPLAPPLVAHIAATVARAIVDLNRATRTDGRTGFVSGMWCPRDVIVTYEGELRLVGLGTAKARLRAQPSSRRLPYVAPEVLAGREPTPRSDVFSLAAIVYEMFAFRSAFRRADDEATRHAVRRGDVAPLRPSQLGVDPVIGDLLMQSLLPRPEARPEDASELAATLRRAAGVDPVVYERELAQRMQDVFREQLAGFQRVVAALEPDARFATIDLRSETTTELLPTELAATDDLMTARGSATLVEPPPASIDLPSEVDAEEPVDPVEIPTGPPSRTDSLTPAVSASSADLEPDELGYGRRVRRIARYRLGRRLEADGPLQLYVAMDPNLAREAEVKVLDPTVADSRLDPSSWVRAIKQEGRYAAQLQLDQVPRLLDAGRGGGLYFLVYERRTGRLLPRHLAEGRSLDPVSVTADLCLALDGLHRAGFVLGEVRPGAVRIRPNGRAEIARMNRLAPLDKAPHPLHGPGRSIECPELLKEGRYLPESDQFGLGVVLYQLLTGVPPFRARRGEPLTQAILSVEPEAPHELDPIVPESLSRTCLRMLSKNPEDRFDDLAAVAMELRGEPRRSSSTPTLSTTTESALEVSLAFAQLCRRVAGISTVSDVEDSVWHPDPAVWSADVARRLGLSPEVGRAVLLAASLRDLSRRTHLPLVGPELDLAVPEVAKGLLAGPRRGDPPEVELGREVIQLVERYIELVGQTGSTPTTSLRRLQREYRTELVEALAAHAEDRLPRTGTADIAPSVLVTGHLGRAGFVDALEKEGLAVVTASDGHSAWEALRTVRFAGAVFARDLLGRDGLSLLRLCRSRSDLESLPLWLEGAGLSPAERRMAEDLGAVLLDEAPEAQLLQELSSLVAQSSLTPMEAIRP